MITLTSIGPLARCPMCATPSSRIHSRYWRRAADLPWGMVTLHLLLSVRRFHCLARDCPRRLFTERLPHLLGPYARRTARAQEIARVVALAVGGEGGSRLIARLRMRLSAATLRRLIRQGEVPPAAPPRIIGVDDFALRRRHRYGTGIADLEKHKIVDLLPDRTATTLATWLRQYPCIEVVSRDRSPEYARGISEGAPQAVQVVDRWHVLRNVREVGERLLDAHRAQWQDIALPDPTDRVPSVRRSRHEQSARQAGHCQRRERYAQVRALHAQGTSQPRIARQLRMGRVTVRRYVRADVFPERAAHRRKPSQLLPFVAYIERRWAEGCTDGVQLWKEIQAQGYGGSRRMIAQWVCQHRQEPAPTTPHKHQRSVSDAPTVTSDVPPRRAASRRLVWLLLLDPALLTSAEQEALGQLRERCPAAATAYPRVQSFVQMVHARTPSAFAPWVDAVAHCDLPALQSFAEGLKQDESAILAALTLPWSNGPLEGFVNKIKTIKRQMYGRARFPMLRQRVLLAA
ncbi:MAG TPA: ISL3 family transposase [Chloroflexota bacterium]